MVGRKSSLAIVVVAGMVVTDCPQIGVYVDDCASTNSCAPDFSGDGDLFSTPVELNETNHTSYGGFYQLDTLQFDENESLALGGPYTGSLEKGVNFVDDLYAYRHYHNDSIDSDDWATLHLINLLEAVGRAWADTAAMYGYGLAQPGDASLKFGGFFTGHLSHRNGIDLDFRYFRNDEALEGMDICVTPSQFDNTATTKFIQMMINIGDGSGGVAEYDSVFVSDCWDLTGPGVRKITDGSHDNHFHIRIVDPDGTNN